MPMPFQNPEPGSDPRPEPRYEPFREWGEVPSALPRSLVASPDGILDRLLKRHCQPDESNLPLVQSKFGAEDLMIVDQLVGDFHALVLAAEERGVTIHPALKMGSGAVVVPVEIFRPGRKYLVPDLRGLRDFEPIHTPMLAEEFKQQVRLLVSHHPMNLQVRLGISLQFEQFPHEYLAHTVTAFKSYRRDPDGEFARPRFSDGFDTVMRDLKTRVHNTVGEPEYSERLRIDNMRVEGHCILVDVQVPDGQRARCRYELKLSELNICSLSYNDHLFLS